MTVYVNGSPCELAPGMTVRHALVAAGFENTLQLISVFDEWGNELGLDGALQNGQNLTVRLSHNSAR